MVETIKEFFSSPEMIALITTAISFLTANLGTLIVFAVKYLKLKATELKNQAQSEKVIEELTARYNAKIEEFAKKVDDSLTKVESAVIKKLDDRDEMQSREIERETIQLEEAIRATKQSLSMTDEE